MGRRGEVGVSAAHVYLARTNAVMLGRTFYQFNLPKENLQSIYIIDYNAQALLTSRSSEPPAVGVSGPSIQSGIEYVDQGFARRFRLDASLLRALDEVDMPRRGSNSYRWVQSPPSSSAGKRDRRMVLITPFGVNTMICARGSGASPCRSASDRPCTRGCLSPRRGRGRPSRTQICRTSMSSRCTSRRAPPPEAASTG